MELDQLDAVLAPMATRIVTDLEVDLGRYMLENCNLSYGTPGQVLNKWSDVAGAGALMEALGVPSDGPWHYVMNPFVNIALADTQSGLASGDNKLVTNAWEKAQISRNFGGLAAMTSNALKTLTTGVNADRAGTLSATPDATYVTHKDTMIQSLAVTGFSTAGVINPGEIVEIVGRNRLNLSTREVMLDSTGAEAVWRGVVQTGTTLSGGAGTILVAGPAINEANGQYNTVDSAPQSGDVVNILGASATNYQPSLFYHSQAFGIGTVKLPKLYSTDTVGTTEDGFSIRCSKYSDGDANQQKIRFDLLPAFATFNPFFAGQGFGTA